MGFRAEVNGQRADPAGLYPAKGQVTGGPCFGQIASANSPFWARALDKRSDESRSTRQKALNYEEVLEAARVAAIEARRRGRRPRCVCRSAAEAPNTHSFGQRQDLPWCSVALTPRHVRHMFPQSSGEGSKRDAVHVAEEEHVPLHCIVHDDGLVVLPRLGGSGLLDWLQDDGGAVGIALFCRSPSPLNFAQVPWATGGPCAPNHSPTARSTSCPLFVASHAIVSCHCRKDGLGAEAAVSCSRCGLQRPPKLVWHGEVSFGPIVNTGAWPTPAPKPKKGLSFLPIPLY